MFRHFFSLFLLLCLCFFAHSSFLSVNSQRDVFIKDIDFDSLVSSIDNSTSSPSGYWFGPVVGLKRAFNSSTSALFFQIRGQDFVTGDAYYKLKLTNLTDNSLLASSSWAVAKSLNVIEFTFYVDNSIANDVFQLQLKYYFSDVPFIPILGEKLKYINGLALPDTPPQYLYISSSDSYPLLSGLKNLCKHKKPNDAEFIYFGCTSEADTVRTKTRESNVSPTYPIEWKNSNQEALFSTATLGGMMDPFEGNLLHKIVTFASTWTGCDTNGEFMELYSCDHWQSQSNDFYGRVGSTGFSDHRYFSSTNAQCNRSLSVMCLEKVDIGSLATANLDLLEASGTLPFLADVALD